MTSLKICICVYIISVLIVLIESQKSPTISDVGKSLSDAVNSLGTASAETINEQFAILKKGSESVYDVTKMTMGLLLNIIGKLMTGAAVASDLLSTSIGAARGYSGFGLGFVMDPIQMGLRFTSTILSLIGDWSKVYGSGLLDIENV